MYQPVEDAEASIRAFEGSKTGSVREFHAKVGADANLALRPLTVADAKRETMLATARLTAFTTGEFIEEHGRQAIEIARRAGSEARREAICSAARAGVHKLGWNGEPEPVLMRLGLMLEEVGEWAQAAASGDVEKATKELADLLYVVLGTAVTFALPVDEAFDEVHKSNMTKSSAAAAKDGNRGKGDGFVPADLGQVMVETGATRHHGGGGIAVPSRAQMRDMLANTLLSVMMESMRTIQQ